MYKLSIGSLLVVLVTLQQHHTAAAMSLAEQFEQLILNLDTEEEQPQNEDYEVCITYNQIQDIIRSFSQCKSSTCTHSLQSIVEELLNYKKECKTDKNFLEFLLSQDTKTYINSRYRSYHSLVNTTYQSFHDIDSREGIMALNCILLI